MKLDQAIQLAVRELANAQRQHPKPADALHAMAVLQEEVGELQKAILQAVYYKGSDIHRFTRVKEEAVQVAAMAIRFLMGLSEYYYCPSPTHDDLAHTPVSYEKSCPPGRALNEPD